MNVYPFTGFGPGKLAAEACFKARDLTPIGCQHALCEASEPRGALQPRVRGRDGL
ncbi:MAG: hypothetical protein ABI135_07710 [Rhodoferax sp.]